MEGAPNSAPEPETAARQPSVPSANGPVKSVALRVSWLVFVIFSALPFVIFLTGASILVLWLFAAFSLLHTGGLAMLERSFGLWWTLGLALMLASLSGAILRRLLGRPKSVEVRQRVIGPGGRVLRVFFEKRTDALSSSSTHPVLSWIPDGYVLLVLFIVVVRWGEWGGNRFLPDGISVLLIAANLYLFLLYIPLWLFRTGWRICQRLLRLARVTEFRAGMFTILFLIPVVSECGSVLPKLGNAPLRPVVSEENSESFRELDGASSFADFHRIAMRATAEALWREDAFDADLRRYLRPWFDAGRSLNSVSDLTWRAPTSSPDWLQSFALRSAWAQSSDDESPFRRCIHSLYPGEVSRAELRVRSQYRLQRAASYDVALEALLAVCSAHEKKPYDRPAAAFWRAVGNRALKLLDPNRRYRREVSSSALGSRSVDCAQRDDTDYPDRCPSPWASPEQIAETWEKLAMVQFCALSRGERTLLLQKGLLRMSDDELADEHDLQGPTAAKNRYQNLRAKVRTQLDGMCRQRRGLDDLLDGL